MSETNNTTSKKVVSFESLEAASALIATKAEVAKVKAQVDSIEPSAVEYATNEEVLALFQETQPAQDQPTQEAE